MISGRLVVVGMVFGFKSEVQVILIKCSLKILRSLLSSKILQFISEIILQLEKLPLSDKYGPIVRQKLSLSGKCLGLPLKNSLF